MSGSLGQSVLHRLLHALLSLIFGQRDVGCSCAILYLDMQVSTIDGDRSWFSVGGLGHKYRRCVGIGNQVSSLEIMGRVIVLDNNDGFLNRNVMLPLCTITQDNLSIIQLRVIDKMLLS